MNCSNKIERNYCFDHCDANHLFISILTNNMLTRCGSTGCGPEVIERLAEICKLVFSEICFFLKSYALAHEILNSDLFSSFEICLSSCLHEFIKIYCGHDSLNTIEKHISMHYSEFEHKMNNFSRIFFPEKILYLFNIIAPKDIPNDCLQLAEGEIPDNATLSALIMVKNCLPTF